MLNPVIDGFRKLPLLGLLLLLTVSGCGYTRHTTLPNNIKTIYVDTVKNDIPIDRLYAYQPGLEIKITNAIIRRLQVDGNLKVVEREQADAILEPVLIAFDQEGLRFSRLESVQEYRLYVVLSMRLLDARSGKVIWEEPQFSGDADYFVSAEKALSQAQATDNAVERLARNVVDRIVEDW